MIIEQEEFGGRRVWRIREDAPQPLKLADLRVLLEAVPSAYDDLPVTINCGEYELGGEIIIGVTDYGPDTPTVDIT